MNTACVFSMSPERKCLISPSLKESTKTFNFRWDASVMGTPIQTRYLWTIKAPVGGKLPLVVKAMTNFSNRIELG